MERLGGMARALVTLPQGCRVGCAEGCGYARVGIAGGGLPKYFSLYGVRRRTPGYHNYLGTTSFVDSFHLSRPRQAEVVLPDADRRRILQ